MSSREFGPSLRAFRLLPSHCLGQVLDLDLFDYCACGCLTCYHAGRRGAPSRQSTFEAYGRTRQAFDRPEALGMSAAIVRLVEAWLDGTRPSDRPAFVTVGLAAEPLPGFAESTTLLTKALSLLLRAGVGISLRTRRIIPDPLIDLFSQHPDRVRITIPLPLLGNPELGRWEPGSGSATQRLYTLQRLRAARLPVLVAIKPVIPFVNDDEAHLGPLVSAVADLGYKTLGASFLRLTPAVRRRLQESSAPVSSRLIFGAYIERLPEGDRALRLPPVERRQATYELLDRLARRRGLTLTLCRCADPDLGVDPCLLWPDVAPRAEVGSQPKDSDASSFPDGPTSTGGGVSRRRVAQVGFTELLRK